MDKIRNGKLIQYIVTALIPILVLFLPTTQYFTADLRLFFAITIFYILLIVFEFMNILVPSILLTAIYILTDLAPANIALAPWTSTLIYMIVGAYALVNVMDECGLLKRISIWCIRKCGGTYNGALYGMFLAGLILGIVTFNNAYLIMVSFAYGVTKSFGYNKPCKESAIMMFMGAVSAHACATAIYNPLFVGLAETGLNLIQEGFTIPWYMQTIVNWPTLLFNLFFIWLITKLYKTKSFNVGHDTKAYFDEQAKAMGNISGAEKKCCIILALLMLYLFLTPFHNLPAAYGFMVLPWLLFLPGIKVGTATAINKISFGLIVFIVSAMSIANVGAHLGLNELVTVSFVPMLSNLSELSILVGTLLSGILANVIMTPGAMLPILCPPFANIATAVGINPLALVMTLILTCDVYIFPHEIACFMILIAFGLINIPEFVKFALIKTLLFIVFFILIQIPYWYIIDYI